jgi:hypothetical protein
MAGPCVGREPTKIDSVQLACRDLADPSRVLFHEEGSPVADECARMSCIGPTYSIRNQS